MRISVVIPSFQRAGDLQRCLEAIAAQTRRADEVIVVARKDDIATLRQAAASRERNSAVRTVQVSQPGLIAALNLGMSCATGDIVVFTDDDSEANTDWIAQIEFVFSQRDHIGAVGGRDRLQLPDFPKLSNPSQVTRVGCLTWFGRMHGNHHCPVRGHSKKVMFLKGVNMAFRKRALGDYKIDPCLRGSGAQVGSEIDLCMHVRRAGLDVVFDDRIVVKHYVGKREAGNDRTDVTGSVWPDIYFNNQYLIAKHFPLPMALTYMANSLVIGLSRYSPGLLVALKWSLKGDMGVWDRLIAKARITFLGFGVGRAARKVLNGELLAPTPDRADSVSN